MLVLLVARAILVVSFVLNASLHELRMSPTRLLADGFITFITFPNYRNGRLEYVRLSVEIKTSMSIALIVALYAFMAFWPRFLLFCVNRRHGFVGRLNRP